MVLNSGLIVHVNFAEPGRLDATRSSPAVVRVRPTAVAVFMSLNRPSKGESDQHCISSQDLTVIDLRTP